MSLLPSTFFAREALDVARDLLGKQLVRDEVTLRITEVEAYRGTWDTACHAARHGRTARNDALWGPGGHAYVYLCYGIHQMLNVATGLDGQASGVLIRACEPIAGLSTVQARRGGRSGPVLLTGPGKVGQALDIDTTWSKHCLFASGGLELHDAPTVTAIRAGPRVGVDYAEPEHRDAPWRLAIAGTRWVSHPRGLADRHDREPHAVS